MSALILVATPHVAFGELLRISLEDSAQYQVRLVQSTKEARAAAGRSVIQIAILDTALTGEPFVPFCYDLLELQPGVRLIVVPPDNNPNHPDLGGLMPSGYLSRPFYLPDLVDLVARLLHSGEKQADDASPARTPPPGWPSDTPVMTLPPWLQEPLTLRGYLENQLPTTQALSALVGMVSPQPGSGTLRASAGCFDDSTSEELAAVVFRYWNRSEKTDLMRFVRLSSDKRDYLIYATQLSNDLVLILVYDNASPLSLIRPQTKTMAQTLASLPPRDYRSGTPTVYTAADFSAASAPAQKAAAADAVEAAKEEPPAQAPEPAVETQPPVLEEPSSEELDDNSFLDRLRAGFAPEDEPPGGEPVQSAPEAVSFTNTFPPEQENEEEGAADDEVIDGSIFNLSAMLGSIPSPDPNRSLDRDLSLVDSAYSSDWIFDNSAAAPIPTLPGGYNGSEHSDDASGREDAEETQPNSVEKTSPTAQTAPLNPDVLNKEPNPLKVDPLVYPTAPSGRPAGTEVNTEPPVKPARYNASLDVRPAEAPSALQPAPEDVLDTLGDTQPNVVSAITNLGQMEPVSPALSLLNYTCVLVPRLPQHYLTGELADKLAGWVHQLCLAFGWRLEGISIRPEYLQWTVQVAPAISPGNLVRIIRQRTSQHIFSGFPHLAGQNPSGDFWAVGYLIVSGAQPPSAQLLRDYIAQTRKRQGINK